MEQRKYIQEGQEGKSEGLSVSLTSVPGKVLENIVLRIWLFPNT